MIVHSRNVSHRPYLSHTNHVRRHPFHGRVNLDEGQRAGQTEEISAFAVVIRHRMDKRDYQGKPYSVDNRFDVIAIPINSENEQGTYLERTVTAGCVYVHSRTKDSLYDGEIIQVANNDDLKFVALDPDESDNEMAIQDVLSDLARDIVTGAKKANVTFGGFEGTRFSPENAFQSALGSAHNPIEINDGSFPNLGADPFAEYLRNKNPGRIYLDGKQDENYRPGRCGGAEAIPGPDDVVENWPQVVEKKSIAKMRRKN